MPDTHELPQRPVPVVKPPIVPVVVAKPNPGESGDPLVQQLVAQRDVHVANVSGSTSEDARKGAQAQIDSIDRRLADLGYAV